MYPVGMNAGAAALYLDEQQRRAIAEGEVIELTGQVATLEAVLARRLTEVRVRNRTIMSLQQRQRRFTQPPSVNPGFVEPPSAPPARLLDRRVKQTARKSVTARAPTPPRRTKATARMSTGGKAPRRVVRPPSPSSSEEEEEESSSSDAREPPAAPLRPRRFARSGRPRNLFPGDEGEE